ncbi:MAG: HEPN domain-containing protein [Pyrinomonadaceae bacterium]
MRPIAREWVDKAEGDFATAERELCATSNFNYDAVCFHAQQCAEKYLKARLQEADIAFGRTHDLSILLDTVIIVEPAWEALRTDLQSLTAFAVAYRYPGDSADEADAREALAWCANVRQVVRQSLNL